MPDLSWVSIGSEINFTRQDNIEAKDIDNIYEKCINLSRVDFTGSNMKGISLGCNLKNAIFCD